MRKLYGRCFVCYDCEICLWTREIIKRHLKKKHDVKEIIGIS